MARTIICCELATGHGGDVALAADMIRAAADAGADLVKIQSYSLAKLNPADPQAEWLKQAWLDIAAHRELLLVAREAGIELFSTPFDADSLKMLRDLGLTRFKIASSESESQWYDPEVGEQWVVSYPWGRKPKTVTHKHLALAAIPLYPTPLECVGACHELDGWSDHGAGLAACYYAIAGHAEMLEVHMALPGRSRVTDWDKSPTEIRILRKFAEDVATMRTGVAERFRMRWSA